MSHLARDGVAETAVRLASTCLLDGYCRQRSDGRATLEGLLASGDPLWWVQHGAMSLDEVRLARALAFSDSNGPAGITAMRMLSKIVDSGRVDLLSSRDIDLFCQLILIHDHARPRPAPAHQLLTTQVAREITADLLHCDRAETQSHFEWVRAFSSAVGIECAIPEDSWPSARGTAFDRVGFVRGANVVSSGPLVSTITACYRPDRGLVSAIRSLCHQTWTDLEIIVIDDGSGPEFEAVLHEVAEMDPRIRMVRNSMNRGTYARRNQGLDLARGRYITFQDADDLSAPDRVRCHAEAMEEDGTLIGTLSACAKVEPSLQITRPGYRARDANASSLMLRASAALPQLGYFHEVRGGADGEYIRRLRARFGEGAVTTVHDHPLMLVRRTPGSLSSGDFSPGRRSRRRWAYQMITRHRHGSVKHASDYFVTRRRARSADFGVVGSVVTQDPSTPQTFDVAYLADFRERNPAAEALRTEVGEALARGLRVALMQCDRPDRLSPNDEPMAGWALDGLLDNRVSLLVDDSVALVTLLVVESAEALTVGLLPHANWTAQRAELRTLWTSRCDQAGRSPALGEATRVLERLGIVAIERDTPSDAGSRTVDGSVSPTV